MRRLIATTIAMATTAWLCTSAPFAFNISEHKHAGDQGAREAFAAMEAKKPLLKLPWMAPPFGKTAGERWVTRPAAKELALSVSGVSAFEGNDILLWVGDYTGYGPGWATFGDLVPMYGDHKAGAAEAFAASISPTYYGALRKIPVTVRKARCVIGGVTIAESTAGWTDLPYRSTVVRITTSGS
jgi:hypothetical protein